MGKLWRIRQTNRVISIRYRNFTREEYFFTSYLVNIGSTFKTEIVWLQGITNKSTVKM